MKHLIKVVTLILLVALSNISFAGHYTSFYVSSGGYYHPHCYACRHYHTYETYETYEPGINQAGIGTLAGGLVGGLLGSTIGQGNGQILAIAAGTLTGAMIGNSVGRNMDETDRMRMERALENNSIGEPAYWRNSHSGVGYRVVPLRNVNVHGNRYCREYRTVAIVAGKKQEIYGTACRQPDGNWKVIS